MRRKRNQNRIRIAGGVWNHEYRFGRWEPIFAFNFHRGSGDEYQTYAIDAEGKLVWAGVSRHTRMTQGIAQQIQRVWLRERREYINPQLGAGRPASADKIVVALVVFPIDRPELRARYEMPQKLQEYTLTHY